MHSFEEILNQIEEPRQPRRWQGCGYGNMAVILGWRRPKNEDASGMWYHPLAGRYHDMQMPAIVDELLKRQAELVKSDSIDIEIGRAIHRLETVVKHLENSLTGDYPEMENMVSEACEYVQRGMEMLQELYFEDSV